MGFLDKMLETANVAAGMAKAAADSVIKEAKDFSALRNVPMEERIKDKPGCVYSVPGSLGKLLDVYDSKVVMTTARTIGSYVASNFTDGEKTVYYKDANGVQFKAASNVLFGYLQLETASGMMNNNASNYTGENSFSFDFSDNEIMTEVSNYIKKRIDEIKSGAGAPAVVAQVSPADELKKFKELLDMGIITQDEFDAKKKQLLGL